MPATSNDEKLALLASLEKDGRAGGMMGKKLNVDRTNGSWSIVSGIKGAFKRHDDDSLTHRRVLEAVIEVFGRSLSAIRYENLDDVSATDVESRLLPIVKAYRGYYHMIQNGYSDRKNKENDSAIPAAKSLNNSLKHISSAIGRRIEAIACAKQNQAHYYRFKQKDFFPTNEDVGKGKCYGISALWLARCLIENKILYQPRFQSNNDFVQRMQKKALKIYALHETQGNIDSGGAIATILDRSIISKPAFSLNLVQRLRNFRAEPKMNQINNIRAHNSAIGVHDKHADARAALQAKISQWDKLQSSSYVAQKTNDMTMCLGNDDYLTQQTNLLFTNMKGRIIHGKNTGFIASFELERKVENNLNDIETNGHALALFYDNTSAFWYFIDPNFGEWAAPEYLMKKIFARIIAIYTVGYSVKNFGYTKVEQDEQDTMIGGSGLRAA